MHYVCVNLFKYVLRQNMHQIISEFSKNHYSGFVVTEKLNSCLQTLTISHSLASFAESAIFVRARENSNDKRQQAKDRKTEYFLGN